MQAAGRSSVTEEAKALKDFITGDESNLAWVVTSESQTRLKVKHGFILSECIDGDGAIVEAS